MSCNKCNTGYQECMPRCHEVAQTMEEARRFRNSYVSVAEENSTVHVDNRGNIVTVSRNPIFSDEYMPATGDYKNVIIYNFILNEAYIFNNEGEYRIMLLYPDNGGSSS